MINVNDAKILLIGMLRAVFVIFTLLQCPPVFTILHYDQLVLVFKAVKVIFIELNVVIVQLHCLSLIY